MISSSPCYAPAYSHKHITAPAGECENGAMGNVKPSFARVRCGFAPSRRACPSRMEELSPLCSRTRDRPSLSADPNRASASRRRFQRLWMTVDMWTRRWTLSRVASRRSALTEARGILASSLLPGWRPWDAPEIPGDRGKRRPFARERSRARIRATPCHRDLPRPDVEGIVAATGFAAQVSTSVLVLPPLPCRAASPCAVFLDVRTPP